MSLHQHFVASTLAAITLASAASASIAAPVFYGPSAYLSSADIPVGFYAGASPTFLDTLEDGTLNGGLSANTGSVISPAQWGSLVDSVDADDGNIDGLGNQGHSWFSGSGSAGITFTFNSPTQLPTAFGLVWTDGAGSITFSARGEDGSLLGSSTFSGFADNSFYGTTADDRFLGVHFAGGVKSITISNSSGGIEVDHIQYGQMVTAVPEPETYSMLLAGLGLMGTVARRRSAKANA